MAIVPLGGKFEIYRTGKDNVMTLVGQLDTTEIVHRFALQEHYVFGISLGSANLTVIDVKQPDNPVEVAGSPFAIGAAAKGIYAARDVYVATSLGIKILDVSVLPSAPVVRGTAS